MTLPDILFALSIAVIICAVFLMGKDIFAEDDAEFNDII